MGKLEYRLLKPDDTFVSIYHYQSIELEQILARRECEFFVKEGVTYKQTSSAVEDDIHIIYVKEHEHGPKDKSCDKWKWDEDTQTYYCSDSSSSHSGSYYHGGRYYGSKKQLTSSSAYKSFKSSSSYKYGIGSGSKGGFSG